MKPDLEDIDGALSELVIETVDTPVVILGADGSIVRFNSASERLTGYFADEAIGRKVWDFLIIEKERDTVKSIFEKTQGENTPTHFTNFWKTKDGQQRRIEWSNNTIRNKLGDVSYILATGIDVTDQVATEFALAETQAYLRSIIDACPVAVITINEQGLIQSFSTEAEHCFGYREAEAIGRNVNILIPEPGHSQHDRYIKHYLETGEKKIIGRARPIFAKRENGEKFPAMLHVSEFKDGTRIFVGFVEDLTHQRMTERRLEETQFQLQHAGRIGAMGEIATSIAHELNQPLTAAASLAGAVSLNLKKTDYPETKDAIELLEDVVGEIRRASEIIRQMRDFIRKRKTEKSLHRVNKVVEEATAVALIGAESAGIKLETDLVEGLGELQMDRIQIQQVLVNVIRNAVDAMQETTEKRLKISTSRIGGFVEIRVEDTGPGITDEMMKRLFEPFATSKESGMGIGLSISKTIIDAHQGKINAINKESGGCVFTINLPEGAYDEAAKRR